MHYDYLIVGAGLFGAVFCQQASASGKKCLCIDKRNHIGGNVYTKIEKNIPIHCYGAHIFHTSEKSVWEYVNSFKRFSPFINSPLAEFKGKRYNLPFNMNTFFQLWGTTSEAEAREKLAEQTAPYKDIEPQNLEQQALKLVGQDIYEILIKGYTQKQWGCPCDELPAFIIKRLPIRFEYNNNYFNDTYQGIPDDGYTPLVQKLLEGTDVILDCDYFSFIKNTSHTFSKTVYTGKIDEFFDYCEGKLDYRSLRFENETLAMPDYQGNAVINYTEFSVPYTRIIEHKHFTSRKSDYTVISREYPLEYNSMREAYYPVNNQRNEQLYNKYKQLAQSRTDVIFGGRLGEYKYYDMDKVILSALTVAKIELS